MKEDVKRDQYEVAEGPACPRGVTCTDDAGHELCQAVRYSSHSKLLRCTDERYCESKLHFADIYLCTCPVRSEIFGKDET